MKTAVFWKPLEDANFGFSRSARGQVITPANLDCYESAAEALMSRKKHVLLPMKLQAVLPQGPPIPEVLIESSHLPAPL
jgi:hypothetical protein